MEIIQYFIIREKMALQTCAMSMITVCPLHEKVATILKYHPNLLFLLENQYGNQLLVMAVAVNTTLQFMNLGFRIGLPVYDSWENFIETEVHVMVS